MASKEVNIKVNFTTCNGVKCYNGKCDGQQKVCLCNEGFFGTHCEYAFSDSFWVFKVYEVALFPNSDHLTDHHPFVFHLPLVV